MATFPDFSVSKPVVDLSFIEQGEFTPVIEGVTTTGTGTYTVQYGQYCKIGDLVFFNARATITAHTGAGNFRIRLGTAGSGKLTTNGTARTVNKQMPYNPVNLTAGAIGGVLVAADNVTHTIGADTRFEGRMGTHSSVTGFTEAIVTLGTVATNAAFAAIAIDTACDVYLSGSFWASG